MRKTMLFASAMIFMLSCNQKELDRTTSQKDSLITVLQDREKVLTERENSMNEFISTFNDIERNLDCVAVRQHIVSLNAENKGDIKSSQKERINNHINAINQLMQENQKSIADLKRKLRSSSKKNKKLEESIATLTAQLNQKNQELADLNERLNALNMQLAQLQTKLDTMTMVSAQQAQTINENLTALHTAYYIIGKTKDLKEARVIDRKGGLLGIGKTDKLNENFDQSKFTRIDYTITSVIPVNSNHVKVITNHPPDSYKLERDGKNDKIVKNIIITDPEKFWSVSKYLVIEGNPVSTDQTMSDQAKPVKNRS